MAILTQQQVVDHLIQRGVPAHTALGVAMNFADESGFNTGISEANPIAGRGGYGLAQWTGPRRVALEDFARSQGKPVDDPGVQMDFFMNENAGPEAAAWKEVLRAPNANEAAVAFLNKWERPASANAARRSARYGATTAPLQGPPASAKQAAPQTAANAPPAAKTDARASFGERLGDALSGFGTGSQVARPQAVQMPTPQFTGTGGQVMPMIAENPIDATRRDQFARIMQMYGIS